MFKRVTCQAGIHTTGGGAATGTQRNALVPAMPEALAPLDTPSTRTAKNATFSGQTFCGIGANDVHAFQRDSIFE